MNVHVISMKGLRPQNEDHHQIILNKNGRYKSLKNVNFFSVYDGHGGKEISKYLKDNLSMVFMNKDLQYPLKSQYIHKEYNRIQREIKQLPNSNVIGSTALVVVNFMYNGKNYLNIINLGDCRCVLSRGNFAIPLTVDHKPNWPQETHRIESLGGKIKFDGHDWRISDLSVSRAFGDVDASPYVTHIPDVFRYELDKTDKFIVLACDGLWDVLSNQDVVNYVLTTCYDSKLKTRINKNTNVAKKLAELAIKTGSTDNVSVIVVFF